MGSTTLFAMVATLLIGAQFSSSAMGQEDLCARMGKRHGADLGQACRNAILGHQIPKKASDFCENLAHKDHAQLVSCLDIVVRGTLDANAFDICDTVRSYRPVTDALLCLKAFDQNPRPGCFQSAVDRRETPSATNAK